MAKAKVFEVVLFRVWINITVPVFLLLSVSLAQGVAWEVGHYAKITRSSNLKITARISELSGQNAVMAFRNGQGRAKKSVPIRLLECPDLKIQGTLEDPTFTMRVDGENLILDRFARIKGGDGPPLVPLEIFPAAQPEDFEEGLSLSHADTVKLSLEDFIPKEADPEDLTSDLKASAAPLGKAELRLLEDFPPVRKFATGEFTFFLSRPFVCSRDQRIYALMYSKVNSNGMVYRRILYRSFSDGGWRSPPVIDSNGYLWKGNRFRAENIHYTQETKTVPELEQILLDLERAKKPETEGEFFWVYFSRESLLNDNAFTYHHEISYYDDAAGVLHDFQKYQPGSNLRSMTQFEKKRQREDLSFRSETLIGQVTDLRDYMQSLVSEAMMGSGKFIPDFKTAPIRDYTSHHLRLSAGAANDIQIRVYDAVLGKIPIEWHMANDSHGRVWVSRIFPKKARITSYGIFNAVIDSGALTHKPLEYAGQIPAPNRAYTKDYDKDYVDITPFLDELLVIKKYREHWQIAPLESQPGAPKRGKNDN